MMKLWAWQILIPAPPANAWKVHNTSLSAHTLTVMLCGKRPLMGWLTGVIYLTLTQRYETAFALHCISIQMMPALLHLPHQP